MISSEPVSTDHEDEIDFMALWQVVWDYKYVIVLATILCGLIAVYFALTATQIFRAETVVTEIRDDELGGAASLASRFGGLASLAGVNLARNSGAAPPARAVLNSRRLAEEFIMRHNLQAELFSDAQEPQSLWFAVKQFREDVLSINDDIRKGVTTVVIDWTDPVVAAHWANEFVALANELIRSRASEDANRNIAYLNEQIEQTNVVELQRVMFNLIENETQTLMLANVRPEYAFAVVDPAVPPESRISPRRTVIVLLGGVLGVFIGIIAAFLHNMIRRHRGSVAKSPGQRI